MPYSELEARPIQELCQIIDCEHKTAPYVDSSDFHVVRTSNVRDGQLLMAEMKYTTAEAYSSWTQRAEPEAGDILFTREAPAGETCLVPPGIKLCMGQRLVMLRPDRNKIEPLFLARVLTTDKYKFKIQRLSIGSTVSRINISDIKSLTVPSPPLSEQKKIAQILSTWDKAITTTERLLANSQQQKKALMQQLLTGKKRLLDENGVRFSGEWKRMHFGDVVTLGKDKFDPKKENSLEECIELEHIEQSTSTVDGSTSTKEATSTKSKFEKNDILFGKLRPYLRKYWLADRAGVCSTEIWVFKTNSSFMLPEYLLQVVQLNSFIDVANKSSGTHMPRADWNVVKDFIIPVPSLSEQKVIADVLSSVQGQIHKLQKRVNILKEEKRALMQQLLTGKRRVQVEREFA